MKRVLQFSLLLNAVLLAVVGLRTKSEMPTRPLRGEATEPAQPSIRPEKNLPATEIPRSKAWNLITSADSRKFIVNLRAMGCPEQTIRDIVTLKVCREFRDRLLTLETEASRNWDYTRSQDRNYWRERNVQRSEMRDEMISTLESLFGQSWMSLTTALRGGPEWGRDALASLSVEARRQIRDVERKYRRELDELQQKKWTGESDVAEMAKARELERDKRAALASVLSPQEFEEYLYRQSSAADYVRRYLPPAKSEVEFRSEVKLALEMEMSERTAAPPSYYGLESSDDLRREQERRRAEFDRRLKELLGEARLAEQQAEEQARSAAAEQRRKAEDEQRMQREFTEMAAEAGASADDANRFYERFKGLEPTLDSKFEEMEKNLTGTPEENKKQMEANIKAELERIAIETMGEKGRAVVEKMVKKHNE